MSAEMGGRLLVVVLGATGTGKSKLGIQLAKTFKGEVISADSMQVYKGLSLTTNKVTTEECQGVPHHCLDFVDPLQDYTVIDFRDKALPIIEDLMREDKLPVVVGGTHYYIESLISDGLIAGGAGTAQPPPQETGPVGPRGRLRVLFEEMGFILTTGKLSCEEVTILESAVGQGTSTLDLNSMTEEELAQFEERTRDAMKIVEMRHPDKSRLANRMHHAKLREVDPERADQLHYNDTRKIKRSLEIFSENGVQHSELLKRQREAAGGSFGGLLRFPGSTVFLWLNADQEVLDKRLDVRVDEMLKQGLLEELEAFHATYGKDNPSPKYTHGIFQTIGLKEFQSYLDDQEGFSKGKLAECVEGLKIATRRYARRQIKWIRGRFLKAYGRQVPPIYRLDGTDLEKWDEKVLAPATAVVQHFLGLPLDAEKLPKPVQRIQPDRHQNTNKEERICKTCMRVFIGNHQWENHLQSKKHQAFVKKKEKQRESIPSRTTPEQC